MITRELCVCMCVCVSIYCENEQNLAKYMSLVPSSSATTLVKGAFDGDAKCRRERCCFKRCSDASFSPSPSLSAPTDCTNSDDAPRDTVSVVCISFDVVVVVVVVVAAAAAAAAAFVDAATRSARRNRCNVARTCDTYAAAACVHLLIMIRSIHDALKRTMATKNAY